MLRKSLVAVLGLAVTLAFSPIVPVNAAPLLGAKSQVSDTLVELAKKKRKAKAKKGKAGKCGDRKSTRLNSSHIQKSRMPSSA